jgi:hypothetical protein
MRPFPNNKMTLILSFYLRSIKIGLIQHGFIDQYRSYSTAFLLEYFFYFLFLLFNFFFQIFYYLMFINNKDMCVCLRALLNLFNY